MANLVPYKVTASIQIPEGVTTAIHVPEGPMFNIGEITVSPAELQTKTVTPTQQQQIVAPDAGYDGLSIVTVNPIPSNYGLITYNGFELTVS